MDPIQQFKDLSQDIEAVVYDEEIESDFDETQQDMGGESGDA